MARYLQHPAVRDDLTAAVTWYQERAGLGAEILSEFERAVDTVLERPRAFRRWSAALVPDLRRYPCPRFPYVIPYLIGKDEIVQVLAFAHMRWRPYWLERMPRRARRRSSKPPIHGGAAAARIERPA